MPQKRLKQQHTGKQTKKTDNWDWDLSRSETESQSDFSECSVSCSLPQSDFSSRSYTVEDIKSFLKVTKNARKVRVDEYFPDVLQFIEKAKTLRNDGGFTNQEVYRLKKILAKLNAQSRLNASNDSTYIFFYFLSTLAVLILFLSFFIYGGDFYGFSECEWG